MENSDIDYEGIFKLDPYSLCKEDKERLLTQNIRELCKFHYKHCNEYKRILDAFGVGSLESNCHTECSEVSKVLESNKDISPFSKAQYDKGIESSNCHTEPLGEVSNVESQQDFSSMAHTKQALAHTYKNDKNLDSYYNAPFLPVRLFKHYALKSIEKSEIIKTMTSSGTSRQSVSQIFLDKQTSLNQTKALSRIMQSFIGNSRMPMIIIDSSHLLQNRAMFSARGAGVLGFSMFAREKIYALDKDMNLNVALIRDFIEKHKGKKILLFGFTFIVWQHFYNELKRLNLFLDLKDSVLIHGGGWKKLISQAVSKEHFKSELESVCGVRKIHNYYGMVEQTGSIYMECECGVLHTPIFADIIVRRARDFSIADMDEEGILELVSLLPHSYPGHIILSEDVGTILGEDDCPCGRKGKYFSINGRIQNAEIRGCSDTYEQK